MHVMCCSIMSDQGSTGNPVTQGLTNAASPAVVNTAQVTTASGTLGNFLQNISLFKTQWLLISNVAAVKYQPDWLKFCE